VAALNGQVPGCKGIRVRARSFEYRTSKHVLPGPAGQAYACAAAIGVILKGIVYEQS